MEGLPQIVRESVIDRVLADRAVAYLEADLGGILIASGGSLDFFGLHTFGPGDLVEDHVDCLAGMVSPDAVPMDLPFMQTSSGATADIHLFVQGERIWVVFVDARQKELAQQGVQQKMNVLSLRHDRQIKILDQYLGKEVAERLEEGLANVEASGERRELSVMFADIRGFTTFSESAMPEHVFETLNAYLGAMIPAVLNDHGVLDKIIGDEIMGIFGMVPADASAPVLAVRAGRRLLSEIRQLNRTREKNGQPLLFVGVGIATGPVSLGVLGSASRKSVTVIGSHVNLASRLQGQAKANQMVVDTPTRAALGALGEGFVERSVQLKGFITPITVHMLETADEA